MVDPKPARALDPELEALVQPFDSYNETLGPPVWSRPPEPSVSGPKSPWWSGV
jgi:hypothetical protein